MGVNINFADVEETEYSALPKGTYDAVIYECDQTEVQNEGGKNPVGTPMLKWTFNITDPDYSNRRAWMNTVLAGGGIGMLKSLLKATGQFTEEELEGELDFDPDDVLGAPVRLVIVPGKNPITGEANHSVKRVLPAEGSADDLP